MVKKSRNLAINQMNFSQIVSQLNFSNEIVANYYAIRYYWSENCDPKVNSNCPSQKIGHKNFIDLPNTWMKISPFNLPLHFMNIKYARCNASIFCSHLL